MEKKVTDPVPLFQEINNEQIYKDYKILPPFQKDCPLCFVHFAISKVDNLFETEGVQFIIRCQLPDCSHLISEITTQLSNNTSSSAVTRSLQSSTPRSRKSTNNENNDPKRYKSSKIVSPFQTQPLTDITNVVGYDSRLTVQSLESQTKFTLSHNSQNHDRFRHDSQTRDFIDLTDNGLVENTITYNTDVPIDILEKSSNLEIMQPILSNSIMDVNDRFFGNEKPKRSYTRRKKCGGDQTDCSLIGVEKSKRSYVRKNNIFNVSNDILMDNGGASIIHPSESLVSEVPNVIGPRVPKKNISRRSSRTSSAIKIDDEMIDIVALPSEYCDNGDASNQCQYCHAEFWANESSSSRSTTTNLSYGGCCEGGIIDLPRLKEPPNFLRDLIHGSSSISKHFQDNIIRSYNNMFCFTSMGGKIDYDINRGSGPPIFKMHGQNYHLIGSLLPENGATPKFAQMYIYDTENEVSNRKNSVRGMSNNNNLCDDIIDESKKMLDDSNKLVKTFRMAKDKIKESGESNVKVRLIGKRTNNKDERTRDLPTCNEVAVLIVGDFDSALGPRDIMVEPRSGPLRRISELNVSYLALQYPLLFPYGEDGYTEDIPFTCRKKNKEKGRKNVSVREYFAFRLHDRDGDAATILSSRRLFQQFVVDAYTMVETSRLSYVYHNQKKLRCEMYRGLADAVMSGDNDPKSRGKRIILPSTFTGGARFMIQNYQDAMAICRSVGYPDLFITFTCNPNWPEIVRFLDARNLRTEDRPDIICRVFKIKLNELIRELRQDQLFGKVVAGYCVHC
ncbi:hypothetical protein CASFOL_029446 [Castilleja foliolosa]|uniref:Helitron helicase-like domain-containing protein n=1 Tax=Castilleja foliolosa TaxID=1961234 RepID=A0ABD3CAV8_9LAMI